MSLEYTWLLQVWGRNDWWKALHSTDLQALWATLSLHDNYNPDSVRRHADVCGQGASSSSASRCSYCTSSHHEDTILYHGRIEWKGRCPYRRAKCPRRGCSGMYEIKISYSNTKAENIGKGYLYCGICHEQEWVHERETEFLKPKGRV